MRALVLTGGNRRVAYVPDYPEPRPAAEEVLIRVRLAGICATDLELARGYMEFSGVPGHEFVGTVEAGPPQLVNRRVVADINCACHACETCRQGAPGHCPHRTVLGIAGRQGAFAEYVALPAGNCFVVPDEVNDLQAVFAEPLAAAAHVLDAIPAENDQRIAVLGTGRLGLLVALVLARKPGVLEVIGRNPRTLALCQRWGLRTISTAEVPPDAKYDVVVECTGNPAGLSLGLRLCRPLGTVVLKSTYAGASTVDLGPVVVDEIRIIGSRCGSLPTALKLLSDGLVPVADLVSATYPLREGAEAFAAAARPENTKVLLTMEPA